MAAILLAGGDRRYITPNAQVMIHQPMGGTKGQATDIENAAKHIIYLKKKLNEMLADFSGKPMKQVTRDTDRDFWMTAKEAIKYGLVDEIIPHAKKNLNPVEPDNEK